MDCDLISMTIVFLERASRCCDSVHIFWWTTSRLYHTCSSNRLLRLPCSCYKSVTLIHWRYFLAEWHATRVDACSTLVACKAMFHMLSLAPHWFVPSMMGNFFLVCRRLDLQSAEERRLPMDLWKTTITLLRPVLSLSDIRSGKLSNEHYTVSIWDDIISSRG